MCCLVGASKSGNYHFIHLTPSAHIIVVLYSIIDSLFLSSLSGRTTIGKYILPHLMDAQLFELKCSATLDYNQLLSILDDVIEDEMILMDDFERMYHLHLLRLSLLPLFFFLVFFFTHQLIQPCSLRCHWGTN